MNRKTLFSLFFLCFAFLGTARADEVTIGSLDGAANNAYLPMNSTYNYSYSQQIYTADEIGMAGTINSITLWMYGNANLYEMPFDIYMVETDKDAFESKTDWETVTADDIVYSGTVTVHNTGAEAFTFDLDNSFVYSGQGNLLIAFNNTTGQWKSGLNGKVFGANSDPDRAIYARQDSGAYDPTDPTFTAYAISSQRNVIELAITPGSGVTCNKPETMEVSNLGANSATLTWTGGSGNYNVEYKLATETNWTPVLTNTTATTTTLNSLTQATDYQARVQSVCSGDATSGWRSVNFTTECGVITDFPWIETFESYNVGDFNDPCWVNEQIGGHAGLLFKVSTSTIGDNSTHKLNLPEMAGRLTKLVLPEMNVPANYEFSIDIYRSDNTSNENYWFEGIRVYASTNGEIEGATELAFIHRQFNVYDAIHNVIPPETEVGWYRYELPLGISGTCYIILQGESQNCTATYIDNLAVKPIPSCPRPTGFAVVSNSVTAHEATVSWTENGEATNWVLAYSYMEGEETMEQQLPITQNPYTITGLIPEMHYFNVCVRANCGEGDYSGWSQAKDFTTTIACPAPTNLVANPGNYSAALNWNGTSDSYIVSYRTAAYAEGIVEEFNVAGVPSGWTRYSGLVDDALINPDTLTLTGSTSWVTTSNALGQYNIKLNIYGNAIRYWLVTPEFNLSQDLSFDLALTDYGNENPIDSDTLQADDRFVVLIYAENAWHILREWNNSGSGDVYNDISATGENVTIDLSAYYGQDVKIAFYGESTSSTGSNAGDNDLHIDNIVCGVPYEAGEWQTITVDETTATIPGLSPETAYEAKVQGDCGELDGQSLETNVITFTTLEACPVPQNVEVESITHNSATVLWDGYNDSYRVSYRTAAYVDGIIENFDAGLPSVWTKCSGLVDQVLDGTITLTTINSGWGQTSYALGQYNMRLNIYGSSIKQWLVTPEFRVSQNLSFDLALTDYNNENPIENPTAQADDRFVVLIYADNTWHILREWNNSGSEFVFNTISTTGENVTIDLSAYNGKKVKIAFYGESTSNTESNAGDNDLHIDNIMCGVPYEASEWQTIDTDASPVILSDLTPEREYEVKVQGFCGSNETEWSEMVSFQTLEVPPFIVIEGFGDVDNEGGWYLIASPVNGLNPAEISGMTDGIFDLFSFNQSASGSEWENYKTHGFNLESGKGYLYAHDTDITLFFYGTLYSGDGIVPVTYDPDVTLSGWNLVGNPFNMPAYFADGKEYLEMNSEGTGFVEPMSAEIAPMQGVFVEVSEGDEYVTFVTERPESVGKSVVLRLSNNRSANMDAVRVRFGGRNLGKIVLNENATKLYIPQNGKDYCVVASEAEGEMPVNFKAAANGTYTLSTELENAKFSYLHLIDNLTGNDVDLLANPSYTFNATTSDYAARFTLVFAESTGVEENTEAPFGFISNGKLIVNGEGMLQVIDVMGHVLSSQQINGSADINLNAAAGVYTLRLSNGNAVKTQKIVVR